MSIVGRVLPYDDSGFLGGGEAANIRFADDTESEAEDFSTSLRPIPPPIPGEQLTDSVGPEGIAGKMLGHEPVQESGPKDGKKALSSHSFST